MDSKPQVRKERAGRNRTLTCTGGEIEGLSRELLQLTRRVSLKQLEGKVICGDFFEAGQHLPEKFVDLLVLDPPYNLSKSYNGRLFRQKAAENYEAWFQDILDMVKPTLKNDATVYVCADWKTSTIIAPILERNFHLRNRITWEREKGRGAKANWKNNTEDIWFCTLGDDYYFDVDAVKVKRRVMAPYRKNGQPKDWQEGEDGNFRMTHPSNIWTDITVPFWSMPENTDHPTQKPEKLIAKLLLASTRPGDFVLDPFLGSGTTAVVAQKLGRRWAGMELDPEYCCWALKRIGNSRRDSQIQGYADGVFWDRNSLGIQTGSERRANGQGRLAP